MTTTNIEKKADRITAVWRNGGCSASYDSFVVGSSAVLRLNFCAKNPPLRQAAKRCMKPLTNITHKYDVKEEMENKKTFCKALCGTKTVRGIY